jgi:hypothetical protein
VAHATHTARRYALGAMVARAFLVREWERYGMVFFSCC